MKVKMSTVALMAGMGALSWMAYKKINPDAVEDMKCAMKKSADKMLKKMEDMN